MSNIVAQIAKHVTDAEAKGCAFLMLSIRASRRRRQPGSRVRIAPGLAGTMRGEQFRITDCDVDLVIELSIADAKAWLKRRGVAL